MTPFSASAHVFVADLAGPELDDEDRWHLTRVLRLRPGADVTAADGAGWWRPCRLGTEGRLEPVGDLSLEPAPRPELTIAFALVKGQRPDLAVQKLTELGVDRIVPFAAERSVVRWDGTRKARHLERFSRIVRQAGMQCRRSRLPAIGLPGDDASAARCLPTTREVALLPGAVMADRAGDPLSPLGPAASTVLVGPEGGWAEAELRLDVPRVRLGGHVLRAETAALSAAALLTALRSDIISSSAFTQVVAPEQDVIV